MRETCPDEDDISKKPANSAKHILVYNFIRKIRVTTTSEVAGDDYCSELTGFKGHPTV